MSFLPPQPPFAQIRSPFSGYSVAFSPFHRNLLAVASSQYYGIAGNGRVTIMNIDSCQPVCEFMTRDGCFDIAWSEKHDHVIAAATGDGSVKIFSLNSTHDPGRPLAVLVGHTAETYSVNWNLFNRDRVCTASWDRSVRVWDASSTECVSVLSHHAAIAYEAKWNPRSDHVVASVGGDGDLVVSDIRQPTNQSRIHAHDNEILCLDWNKYREYTIATGCVDRSIRVWDVRKGATPLNVLNGHDLAVRRLRFSPHSDSLLASCSYDMTVKIWSIGEERMTRSLIDTYDHHTEFVVGLDYSNFHRDLVASTGWDRMVAVWTVGSVRRPGSKLTPPQIVHDRRIRQSAA